MLKVLMVDDGKTIPMIVERAFQPYICEVLEAENGVQGLSATTKGSPGLIISDNTLPLRKGMEMLDRPKSDANFKNIPVIILTAESGKDHAVNIVKKGIKDYMIKPFKGQDMLERVRKIMPLEPWMDVEFLENWAGKYFTQFDDIVVMRLPAKITRLVSVEVEGSL